MIPVLLESEKPSCFEDEAAQFLFGRYEDYLKRKSEEKKGE